MPSGRKEEGEQGEDTLCMTVCCRMEGGVKRSFAGTGNASVDRYIVEGSRS